MVVDCCVCETRFHAHLLCRGADSAQRSSLQSPRLKFPRLFRFKQAATLCEETRQKIRPPPPTAPGRTRPRPATITGRGRGRRQRQLQRRLPRQPQPIKVAAAAATIEWPPLWDGSQACRRRRRRRRHPLQWPPPPPPHLPPGWGEQSGWTWTQVWNLFLLGHKYFFHL